MDQVLVLLIWAHSASTYPSANGHVDKVLRRVCIAFRDWSSHKRSTRVMKGDHPQAWFLEFKRLNVVIENSALARLMVTVLASVNQNAYTWGVTFTLVWRRTLKVHIDQCIKFLAQCKVICTLEFWRCKDVKVTAEMQQRVGRMPSIWMTKSMAEEEDIVHCVVIAWPWHSRSYYFIRVWAWHLMEQSLN